MPVLLLSVWQQLLAVSDQADACQQILNEQQLDHPAAVQGFVYRAWMDQQPAGLKLAMRLVAAAVPAEWLTAQEAEAWLFLLAARLCTVSEADEVAEFQALLVKAGITDWHNPPLPDSLKVRSTPLGYALAVRASTSIIYQQPLDDPEYLRRFYWPEVRQDLQDYWQIYSGDDARQLLYWLAGQGQRHAWQLDAAWLQQADEEARQIWLDELSEPLLDYADLIQELAEGATEPLDVHAWDWVRMADLALAAYMAGYLGSSEWRCFALIAVWLLRSRYTTWQSIVDSYLLGYELWQSQEAQTEAFPDPEHIYASLQQLPFAPMQQLQWQELSLDHPDFHDALQRFSVGLEQPFMLTALVASLRDDGALLTGLNAELLPETRRQESRDFLGGGLELAPGESLATGLSRFWQPGRVHHYDQLALHSRTGKQPHLPDNLEVPQAAWDAWKEQQPLLAALVHSPSAIVMAEKYAFYLLKTLESGQYAADEIEQLCLALQDYLSWHYTSAQQMLQAWKGWDELLSATGEERSLQAEISWHLQDHGSLFRFLKWQRAPRHFVEPGKPVSETDLAVLNLVGPLTGIHWSWPERLPPSAATELKGLLQETHLFQTGAELQEYLTYLLQAGDRQEYLISYAPLTLTPARLQDEIDLLEAEDERGEQSEMHYQRLLRVQRNDLQVNDVDLLAWDMAQLVDLAVAGYQLGWLEDAELRHWLQQARVTLQQTYSGWSDMARALLAGYNFFVAEGEQRNEQLSLFQQRLYGLLLAVPVQFGLWFTLAWPGEQQARGQQSAAILTGERRLH